MNNSIYPCLWFDDNGKEAADFYCQVFNNTSIIEDNGMVQMLDIFGQRIMLLNGGPIFQKNASISFLITCDDEAEIQSYWNQLEKNGIVLMPLNEYPWSKLYGWIRDQFGVTWQFYLGDLPKDYQRLVPQLMFLHDNNGKASEAMEYYSAIFTNSKIEGVMRYKDGGEEDIADNVQHAQFTINGYTLFCNDSSIDHSFDFSEGISMVVNCEDQNEIDYYWNAMTADGGEESKCGWLKDKYGVSWQIVPKNIGSLLQKEGATQNLLQMNKIVIAEL